MIANATSACPHCHKPAPTPYREGCCSRSCWHRYRYANRPPMTFTCRRCGKKFVSLNPASKYCTSACRKRKPPRPAQKCRGCEVMFVPANERQKYHSEECQRRDYEEKHRKILVRCETCGDEFLRIASSPSVLCRRCTSRVSNGYDEDREPEGYDPSEFVPTIAPQGSRAKIEVLAERVRLGLPLWHPLDSTDASGETRIVGSHAKGGV